MTITFNGNAEIRRVYVEPNGNVIVDININNNWGWYGVPTRARKEMLSVALAAITSGRLVVVAIEDNSTLINFGLSDPA